MRVAKKVGLFLILAGAGAAVGIPAFQTYWEDRAKPQFREAEVVRGDIVSWINATGTIHPLLRVEVGTLVSGIVEDVVVNFNAKVRSGELLAKLDPRPYKAAVARDEAALGAAQAEVARVKTLRQRAINDQKRAEDLRAMNKDYIADTVLDQYKFGRLSLEKQLEAAEAAVSQAAANLQNSKVNLDYTKIRSPVDGIVIERKVNPGQAVALMVPPALFVVALDMEKEVYVQASVNEADIGRIQKARHGAEPVTFTVESYPEEVFQGTVDQIRMNPTTEQNVVTFPVVVKAANRDMKLLPGMTANLSFPVEKHPNVLKIPNAALRFNPKPEQVRREDRRVLEGRGLGDMSMDSSGGKDSALPAVARTAKNSKVPRSNHVWEHQTEWLKAIEVTTGLSDEKYAELMSGDLREGQRLVTEVRMP